MTEEQPFAFVLMPFDIKFNDIYKFGIKEPALEMNIRAERVDEQLYHEGILERIYRQIEVADIIIADMSTRNPNVFYEVGYAHAKQKLCILLTTIAEDIPFDLKHKRHIVYGGSIKTLKDRLLKELEWAKKETENIKKSNITVSIVHLWGTLNKTKYSARAVLDFKIDLKNDTNNVSPDIEAIYLYTFDNWQMLQNDKLCPSKQADITPFKLMHFLHMPVPRLSKSGWVQLQLQAKKTIAASYKGEPLKDSYRISSKSLLRLITKENIFDYELPIEVTVDDIPF